MIWVDIKDEMPISGTRVIVKTKTQHTKGNVLEVSFHYDEKGRPVWGCNNQTVYCWLKEN